MSESYVLIELMLLSDYYSKNDARKSVFIGATAVLGIGSDCSKKDTGKRGTTHGDYSLVPANFDDRS
jgi:major membrane immunogen (membrane-anchored lipoprotein)